MYARKAELFHCPIVPDCGSSNPAVAALILTLCLAKSLQRRPSSELLVLSVGKGCPS